MQIFRRTATDTYPKPRKNNYMMASTQKSFDTIKININPQERKHNEKDIKKT